MTASDRESQLAAAAQAQGEAAEVQHMADALAQHAISGSTVAVESAATPDDTAVSWTGSDRHGRAGVSPQG